jgi:hypothetical protein
MPPVWSVPAKRTQTSLLRAKRRRPDDRINSSVHTPSKQVHFFSSPRCPPSPHHKPRASSPLRASAISPIVIIKRPARRQPLGQLIVVLQNVGNTSRRITSKDFELYEDTSPFKYKNVSRPTISPTKCNNKENIPPIGPLLKEQKEDDPFERPLPRDPLNKLKRHNEVTGSDQLTMIEKIVMEEIITTDNFAGEKIIHEMKMKNVSSNVIIRTASDDTKSISREETWGFQIHQDNAEDEEIFDIVDNVGDVIMEEEDKENVDPTVEDKMEGHRLGASRSCKRRYSEN